jgi:hypothetical protein
MVECKILNCNLEQVEGEEIPMAVPPKVSLVSSEVVQKRQCLEEKQRVLSHVDVLEGKET